MVDHENILTRKFFAQNFLTRKFPELRWFSNKFYIDKISAIHHVQTSNLLTQQVLNTQFADLADVHGLHDITNGGAFDCIATCSGAIIIIIILVLVWNSLTTCIFDSE